MSIDEKKILSLTANYLEWALAQLEGGPDSMSETYKHAQKVASIAVGLTRDWESAAVDLIAEEAPSENL